MTNFIDLYHQLFGKVAIKDGNVIDFAEHGRVGGVSTGQSFKFVSNVDATTGTANPLPTGAATSTSQTDGNQKTQIVDAGGEQVTVTGGKLDVNASISSDIEIGAVEIKNSTDDTRATVDSYGLATKATIKETVPTDTTKNNPSTVLSFNAANQMIYIDEVIAGNTYRTTVSGTGAKLITDYTVSYTQTYSASVKQ